MDTPAVPHDAVEAHRETIAQRIVDHLGNQLPDASLLCVFGDQDWQPFRDYTMPTPRTDGASPGVQRGAEALQEERMCRWVSLCKLLIF